MLRLCKALHLSSLNAGFRSSFVTAALAVTWPRPDAAADGAAARRTADRTTKRMEHVRPTCPVPSAARLASTSAINATATK